MLLLLRLYLNIVLSLEECVLTVLDILVQLIQIVNTKPNKQKKTWSCGESTNSQISRKRVCNIYLHLIKYIL